MTSQVPPTIATRPSEVSDVETSIPNLNTVLWAIHDHLGQMSELLKDLRGSARGRTWYVDVRRSAASVTSITLSLTGGGSAWPLNGMFRLKAIDYGTPAAAILTIGERQIPVSNLVTPPYLEGMIIDPQVQITLALAGVNPTAGAMYLELTGELIPPDAYAGVIR